MWNRVGVAAAIFATAAVAASAQGFECAPLKASTSRSPAYRMVSGQARCEGFFERNVSQPFIELVSLTRGPLPLASDVPPPAIEVRTN